MQWCFGEVFEDQHHIELLQSELNTFQGRDLDFTQGHYEEGRIREVHQAFSRWLESHIGPVRNTLEG